MVFKILQPAQPLLELGSQGCENTFRGCNALLKRPILLHKEGHVKTEVPTTLGNELKFINFFRKTSGHEVLTLMLEQF